MSKIIEGIAAIGCLWLLVSGFAAAVWALFGGPPEAGLYAILAFPFMIVLGHAIGGSHDH